MKIPDTIHILGLSTNKPAITNMVAEVERIGRKPEVFVNITSKWDQICCKGLGSGWLTSYMRKPKAFSCARGHYHIAKAFSDLGDESVWIVEDDARFLLDVDRVNDTLNNAPADADILILDSIYIDFHTPTACMNKAKEAKNGWWKITDNDDVRSAGNHIFSNRAARLFADILSGKNENVPAVDTVRNHKFFPNDFGIYVAYPNLSIQRKDANNEGIHMSSMDVATDRYIRQGLDLDNYAVW